MKKQKSIWEYAGDEARRFDRGVQRGYENWLEANRQKTDDNLKKQQVAAAQARTDKRFKDDESKLFTQGVQAHKERYGRDPIKLDYENGKQYRKRIRDEALEKIKANEKQEEAKGRDDTSQSEDTVIKVLSSRATTKSQNQSQEPMFHLISEETLRRMDEEHAKYIKKRQKKEQAERIRQENIAKKAEAKRIRLENIAKKKAEAEGMRLEKERLIEKRRQVTDNKIDEVNQHKDAIEQQLSKEISEIDKDELKKSFEEYHKFREGDNKNSLDYDFKAVNSQIKSKRSFLEGIKDDCKKLWVAKTLLDIEGDGTESGYLKKEVKKYQKIVDQKYGSEIGNIRHKLKEVVGESDKASKLGLYKDDKRSDEEKEFEVTKFFLQASHQRKEYIGLGQNSPKKVERIRDVLEARFNEKKSDKDQKEVKELFKVLKKFDPKIQSDLLDSPPRGKLAFFKKLFGLKEEIKLPHIEVQEITKFSADYKKLDRVEADNTTPPAPAQPAQTPPTPSHEATNTKLPAPAEPDQTPPTPPTDSAPANSEAYPAPTTFISEWGLQDKKSEERIIARIEREKKENKEKLFAIIEKINDNEGDEIIIRELSIFFKSRSLGEGLVIELLTYDFHDIEKNKKLTTLAKEAINGVVLIPGDPEKLLKQREEGFSPPPPPSLSPRPQPQPSTSAPPQTQHLDPFGIQGLGGVIDSLCKPMIGGGFFGLSVDSGKPGSSQNSGNKR